MSDIHTDVLRRVAEEAARETVARMSLTKEDVKAIVKEAVSETLTRMGMEADDPMEMQRDMLHLRNWRRAMESVQSKGVLTVTGLAISGVLAAFWLGLKELVHK